MKKKIAVSIAMIGLAAALSTTAGTSAQADDFRNKIAVKYGATGGYTSTELAIGGWYTCNNGAFGGDPAPHEKKACFINGRKVADEGQKFTTPAPECPKTRVSYVAVNGASKERDFCPGRRVICSNAVFGSDPAVGVVKHCESNGKRLTTENQAFETPWVQFCLCNGKSLYELNDEAETIKDAYHD